MWPVKNEKGDQLFLTQMLLTSMANKTVSRKQRNIRIIFENSSWKSTDWALYQTHLHVKWNQWLQIWTRSDHGYHTTAVHLVLVRHIFNGYIYILKIYAHCITLHYKMYKGCHKNWMIPIYMYPWIWKLDLFKAYKMCSFQEMWCSFLCLNIIHSLPLINDYNWLVFVWNLKGIHM